MLSYWKNKNGNLRQIESNDNPSLYAETLAKSVDQKDEQGNIIQKATWQEITEQEYLELTKEPEPLKPTYEQIVQQKIRARYSIDEELAIQRQRDTKPDEFQEYNNYCEQCKAEARIEVL